MLIIIHIYFSGLNKAPSFINYTAKFFILTSSWSYGLEIGLYLLILVKPWTRSVEGFGKLI